MITNQSQFRWLSVSLVILLASCTTGGTSEQGEATSSDVTAAGDTTAEAAADSSSTPTDATTPAEGTAPDATTSEPVPAPADAGTLTDAQTPATDPAAAGTNTDPAATSSQDGLAATDGKTPDAAASTPSTETPASATIPDAGSGATAAEVGGAAAAPGAAVGAGAATAGDALTDGAAAADKPVGEAAPAAQEASDAVAAQTAPVVMKSGESNTMEAAIDRDQQRRDYTFGTKLFGSSRMQLAVNHPTFNEGQKSYNTLYGKEKDYPTFTVDWFPVDWWVNPGISATMGGYTVTGNAAIKGSDPDNLAPDPNSQTTLLFVPLQASFKVEMTPFRKKWIVFDGWFGYEYGWWQETTSTASSVPTLLGSMASGSTTTDTSKPTSKGVKSATVFGASAHILLDGLDERTVRSMIATMGLAHVYLTPFFETVKTINKSGLTFGRNIYGLGFTFESLR